MQKETASDINDRANLKDQALHALVLSFEAVNNPDSPYFLTNPYIGLNSVLTELSRAFNKHEWIEIKDKLIENLKQSEYG